MCGMGDWLLKDRELHVIVEEPLKHIGNCAQIVRTLQETVETRLEPKKNATHRREKGGSVCDCLKISPGLGFEPRKGDSESPVIPFHHPGIFIIIYFSECS